VLEQRLCDDDLSE
jgi:hypothetical protein